MSIELKIPEVGESITEVEIGGWLKNQGDHVEKDESVVSLESEKATVELPAPESGTIGRILKQKGETAKVGEVIGYLEKDGQATAGRGQKAEGRGEKSEAGGQKSEARSKEQENKSQTAAGPKPEPKSAEGKEKQKPEAKEPERRVMPAAERALAASGLRAEQIEPSGPGGRVLKEDVLRKTTQPEQTPAT